MTKTLTRRSSRAFLALVALPAASVLAAELPELVVESSASVKVEQTGQGLPGGASIEMLSVNYHVNVGNLDLTKQADVQTLEALVKAVAKKGCDSIAQQYPLRSMSDAKTCVDDAVKKAAPQEKALIAAAAKKAKP